LFGRLKRIELFATERVPGWDATGYDVDGTDIRDFLAMDKTVDKMGMGYDKTTNTYQF